MKKYVFMTCNLHTLGGMQTYVAGKAKYLEEIGWEVYALFPGDNAANCSITSLNKYVDGGFFWLNYLPCQIRNFTRKILLKQVANFLGDPKGSDEVIIESHNDRMAPWGELLAKRLNAKHITALLNEIYVGPNKHYREYIDFYRFKLERKELPFGGSKAKHLFDDETLAQKYETRRFAIDEDPVQDVDSPLIDSIKHDDWNIGHIGRAAKRHVPVIIDGICEFAKNHPDHHIQFINIGDFSSRKEYYDERSKGIDNLTLVELGNQSPIPRCFFKKVDVIIAASGSARCSVYEGISVLVPNAKDSSCAGLLGYETKLSVIRDASETQMSFAEGLERTLVMKVYEDMTFDYPPKPGVAECVKQNFEFIETSEQTKQYYPESKLCKGKKVKLNSKFVFRSFVQCYFPKTYERILERKRNKRKNRKKEVDK